MQRLIKILILSLIIHLGFQQTSLALELQKDVVIENQMDIKNFQEKPKNKKEKTESVESPIQSMFRDLLEYLYFPGVPEGEKSKPDSTQKSSPDSQKKKN